MPYLGRGLEKGNYLKLDDISSQFDGSKTTFNLTVGGSAHVPGSSYSLLVSLSGIVQEGEAAYTLDQNEITFAAAPQAADDCFIISLGTPLGIGVPSNGTVNGTQLAKPLNYDNFFHLDHVNDRVGIGTSIPIQSLDVYDGNIAIRDPATASQFLGFYHNRNVLKASIDKTGNNLTFENVDSGIIDYKIGGSSRVSIGSTGKIFFATDDNTYFYRPGADTLAFVTAGTERLRIKSDGTVGINSAIPDSQFLLDAEGKGIFTTGDTLSSNDFNKGQFTVRNVAAGQGAFLDFRAPSSNGIGRGVIAKIGGFNTYSGTGYDGELTFSTRQNSDNTMVERLRIDSSGSVGIGTNDPSDKLSIAAAPNSLVFGAKDTTRGNHIFQLLADDSAGNGELRLYKNSGSGTHEKTVEIASSGDSYFLQGSIGIGEATPDSKLDILHSSSTNPDTENLIHLRTDPGAGYVSRGLFIKIGRDLNYDNSGAYYDIVGSSGNSGFHGFQVQGNDALRITKDRNVGIGITTPNILNEPAKFTELTLGGRTEGAAITLKDDNDNVQGGLFTSDNTGAMIIRTITNHPMMLRTNNSERLRITNEGKVGISTGTIDPENNQLLIRGASTVGTHSGHIMLTGDGATVNEGPQIVFSESGSGSSYAGGSIGFERKGSNSIGDLVFGTRQSSGVSTSTTTEVLRLNSQGTALFKGNGGNFEQVEANPYDASLAQANGKITIKGDLSGGNYFGWRQKGVASGSVTDANAIKKLPTINDFTYPNTSNGMLIASTTKIGFSASSESPQHANGVTMLFDANGLAIGNNNAFDCNDTVSNASTAKIRLLGSGKISIGTTDALHSSGDNLIVGSGSGEEGMSIYSGTTSAGVINFADGNSSSDRYDGRILYNHGSSPFMRFHVGGGTERLRIDSNGFVSISTAPSSGQGLLNIKPGSADSFIKFRKASDFDATFDGTAIDNRNSANNANRDLIVRFAKCAIWAGGTEKLRIGPQGQLGISGANYGTSGQVLTSTGSSTGLSWKTPMSVLISSTTVSSQVSSVTFTEALDGAFSDYGIYIVTINGMRVANDDRDLHCRIRTGTNGATQIASNDYISMTNGPSADETFSATSQWRLNYNNIGNEIAGSYQRELFNATFYFYGFEANKRCRYHGMSTYQNSSGTLVGQFVNGVVTDSSATTGLEFFSSSGNIALGKFSLFGVNA